MYDIDALPVVGDQVLARDGLCLSPAGDIMPAHSFLAVPCGGVKSGFESGTVRRVDDRLKAGI